VDMRDENKFTPLHHACLHGKLDCAMLLIKKGADLQCRGANGLTPLFLAIYGGHIDIMTVLLKNGARQEIWEEDSLETPLMIAVRTGLASCLLPLLMNNADVLKQNRQGNSALHIAVLEKNEAAINLLIQYKSDPYMKNLQGKTSIQLAIDAERNDLEKIMTKEN